MKESNFNHVESTSAPLLETRMEERLLASGLVSEIRKSPGHYSFTMTDTGIMEFARALKLSEMEDSLTKEKDSSCLFPESDGALLTKKDVLTGFNVSHTTLWKWERNGYLVPVRIGRRVYYRREDILKLTSKI